jgi:cytochrome c556
MRHVPTLILAAAITAVGGIAFAQDDSPEERALEIRQGHMLNYATNVGVLAGMAQGNADYDAQAAQRAADNLFHLASIDQSHYWLPGTAQGEIEDSAALPAIWENMADFEAKHAALLEAVTALQSTAGTDLAAVQAGLGAVGQACGACHQTYRARE